MSSEVESKKKDKAVITDEVWTNERIKQFLYVQPVAGENASFHQLQKAYQSMRCDDFKKFIVFFTEAGGDIKAVNKEGKTLAEVIHKHKHAKPYLDILDSH